MESRIVTLSSDQGSAFRQVSSLKRPSVSDPVSEIGLAVRKQILSKRSTEALHDHGADPDAKRKIVDPRIHVQESAYS